ncbi:MAG: DEAD/DEAH box helicase [Tenericutes bacterium]|nr:DEAD/DEAH box helicase [Mycoplasmatota bacterium]
MYIKDKLKQLGFEKTTPIQDGVFKAISSKKHLVGLAPTGTGKTHAYLLPILANLDFNKQEVQVVICVPTNELVIQVEKMLKEIEKDIRVKAYYGGSDKQREKEWLERHQPQIVIATPQRLNEFVVEFNILKIQTAKYFVLDEADMMFDYDFLSLIDSILPAMYRAKYLLFSATIYPGMEPFIQKYFGSYDFIDTTKKHVLDIEYQLINIKFNDRLEALNQVIEHINPYLCFIFVSKKENQEAVYQSLLENNKSVININATLGVKARKKIIEDINLLKYQYVVTSDLAARGLDFKISHVIHYDLPHHLEFFMHRSGRTGRMYDSGVVITFMSVHDHRKIEKLKEKGIPFKNYILTKEGITKVLKKPNTISEEERNAIKKIKKPKKVTPNYKKKNALKIKKAKQEIRRKQYAKDR